MSAALEAALIVVAVLVALGVLAGVAQVLGWLPEGWSAERFRQWFDRRRDGGNDDDP